MMKSFIFTLLLLGFSAFADSYQDSLRADFIIRDLLPQTDIPRDQWDTCCWTFGPWPATYPVVYPPSEYDSVIWRRDRVITVAKKYIGLPYRHKHTPMMGGMDCSNFTSWVYNYGLGIRFVSNVEDQAEVMGRLLSITEPLQKGDLIYLWSEDHTRISHVAIYIDENHVIDSTGPGVDVRPFDGKYKNRFAWARRVIE